MHTRGITRSRRRYVRRYDPGQVGTDGEQNHQISETNGVRRGLGRERRKPL